MLRKNFPGRKEIRKIAADTRTASHAAKGCNETCKKNRKETK